MMDHFFMDKKFGEEWFDYPNVYDLFVAFLNDGGTFVEVGSWKGKSISYFVVEMLKFGKKINVNCVDLWGGNPFDGSGDGKLFDLFLENVKPIKEYLTLHRGDSSAIAENFANGSCDVIFLDGNHSKPKIRQDICAWWPKVRAGGLLAGHDISWSWVFEAVGEELYRKNKPGFGKMIGNCWIWAKGKEIHAI
jgi:hypothetical protein